MADTKKPGRGTGPGPGPDPSHDPEYEDTIPSTDPDKERLARSIAKLGADVKAAEAEWRRHKAERTATRAEIAAAGGSRIVVRRGKQYRISPEGIAKYGRVVPIVDAVTGKPVIDPHTGNPMLKLDPRTGKPLMEFRFPKGESAEYLSPIKMAPTATRAVTLETREVKGRERMAKSKKRAEERRGETPAERPPSLYTLQEYPIMVVDELIAHDPKMVTVSAYRYGGFTFLRFQALISLKEMYELAALMTDKDGATQSQPPYNTVLIFPTETAAVYNFMKSATEDYGLKFQVRRSELDYLRSVAEASPEEFVFRAKTQEGRLRELEKASSRLREVREGKEVDPTEQLPVLTPEQALSRLGLPLDASPMKIKGKVAEDVASAKSRIQVANDLMTTLSDEVELTDTRVRLKMLELYIVERERLLGYALRGAQERHDAYAAERAASTKKALSMRVAPGSAPEAFPVKTYVPQEGKLVELEEEEMARRARAKAEAEVEVETAVEEPTGETEGLGDVDGDGGEEVYTEVPGGDLGNGVSQSTSDDDGDEFEEVEEEVWVDEDGNEITDPAIIAEAIANEKADAEAAAAGGPVGDAGGDGDGDDLPLSDPEDIEEVEIEYQGENVRQGNAFTDGMRVFAPRRVRERK